MPLLPDPGRPFAMGGSESHLCLEIKPVRVLGADRGPGLFDIFASKEMTVPGLDHHEFGYDEPGDKIDLAAQITVVVRVDAEAVAGSRTGAATGRSGHVVGSIVSVGQPEEISFERQGKARMRFDGEDRADRMDVLQRRWRQLPPEHRQ